MGGAQNKSTGRWFSAKRRNQMLKIANFVIQLALAGVALAPIWGVPMVACAVAAGVLTVVAAVMALIG